MTAETSSRNQTCMDMLIALRQKSLSIQLEEAVTHLELYIKKQQIQDESWEMLQNDIKSSISSIQMHISHTKPSMISSPDNIFANICAIIEAQPREFEKIEEVKEDLSFYTVSENHCDIIDELDIQTSNGGGSGHGRDDGDDEKKRADDRKYVDESKTFPSIKVYGNKEQPRSNKTNFTESLPKYELCCEPSSTFRAKGNINVPERLTKVTGRIDKAFSNLYRYIDKTSSLQLGNGFVTLCNDGEIKIVPYDFYDSQTKERLYCVMEKQPLGTARKWRLRDNVYTMIEIVTEFKIDQKELPISVRSTQHFTEQLNHKNAIERIINNIDIVSAIKWNKVPIQKRKENKKRLTLSFQKEEFMKSLMNYMNDNEVRLVDSIMFDNSSKGKQKYRIAYVWIVRIAENTDIGISLTYNQKNDSINIHNIHLDKLYLLEQHELVNRNHDCHCLDSFTSNINDLVIGNPDDDKNRVKQCQKTIEDLKQKIMHLKKVMNDTISNNLGLKHAINDKEKQRHHNNQKNKSGIVSNVSAENNESYMSLSSETPSILKNKLYIARERIRTLEKLREKDLATIHKIENICSSLQHHLRKTEEFVHLLLQKQNNLQQQQDQHQQIINSLQRSFMNNQ